MKEANVVQKRIDVDAILRAQDTQESRFVLAARRAYAAREARTGCRFACAERGASPYCPTHAMNARPTR